MLDLTVSGSSMPQRRSFQLAAPGAAVVKFHHAAHNQTSTGKDVLTIAVVSTEEYADIPDHRSSDLYGKHQFAETNLYFTERAIQTVTQGFIAHLLEEMKIKDQFIQKISAISNPTITDYANALNSFLTGKEMAVIFCARATYKEREGSYTRYLNNDGIYLLGLSNPASPNTNQQRFSVGLPSKLAEMEKWAEHNAERLVRDPGEPVSTTPTAAPPISENDYEF